MSSKNKLILTLVLGILLNAGFIFLVSKFVFLPIQNSYQNLRTIKSELAILEEKARLLKDLERIVAKEKENITSINAAFLKPDEVVAFVETLEAIAASSNIKLVISTADVPAATSGAEKSTFSLSVEGTFPNVFQYITLIERAAFQVEIKTANLGILQDGQVRADLEISALTAA